MLFRSRSRLDFSLRVREYLRRTGRWPLLENVGKDRVYGQLLISRDKHPGRLLKARALKSHKASNLLQSHLPVQRRSDGISNDQNMLSFLSRLVEAPLDQQFAYTFSLMVCTDGH